jgi:S-methylmethionine-dependent homocysteine/selenocysteine methylase
MSNPTEKLIKWVEEIDLDGYLSFTGTDKSRIDQAKKYAEIVRVLVESLAKIECSDFSTAIVAINIASLALSRCAEIVGDI